LRSDPEGTWEKELEWAKEVWNGKPLMSAEEAQKFYAVSGYEITDDNDDSVSFCNHLQPYPSY
jgi:hypothetical protein